MRGLVVGALVVAASACRAAVVRAEEPQTWKLAGPHVVVGAERAASALFWRERDLDIPGTFGRDQGVDVSALSAGLAKSSSSLPRFAADYVSKLGLSFGGNAGVGYSKTGHPSKPHDPPHQSASVFGARAGYLLPVSPRLALWPRLGLSRTAFSASDTGDESPLIVSTTTTWDLTIDPQLLVVIAPRVVFTTGVLLDLGIAGKRSWDSDADHSSRRYRSSAYGVSAGMAVMF